MYTACTREAITSETPNYILRSQWLQEVGGGLAAGLHIPFAVPSAELTSRTAAPAIYEIILP